MKIKKLVAFWFKTLHMWRLSITGIVGIQLQLDGFKVQKNYCIQNSSGGPSGHINVDHNIHNHLFQNFTTAEIIRHKFSCSGKAAKNSCIFHTFKFISVHICNYYLPVASDQLFNACRTTQRQAIVGFDKKKKKTLQNSTPLCMTSDTTRIATAASVNFSI